MSSPSSPLPLDNGLESVDSGTHLTLELALEETPRRGGRQQPHQALKKFKKYKGSKKRHPMVAQSSPKMPK
jgi:hypothetical protein